MFYYTAFGLKILSAIEIPEFEQASFEPAPYPDITIQLGQVKKLASNQPLKYWGPLTKSRQEMVLSIEEVGKFRIFKGDTITIEPAKWVASPTLRLYLLGSCMGLLFQQRNTFCLHASGVINKKEKAILFLGDSGAGKSTICRYLVNQGYQFICDDYIPIYFHQGEIFVQPSFPKAKLWQSSIDLLKIPKRSIHHRIKPNQNKFGIIDNHLFFRERVVVGNCFLLKWHKKEEVINSILGFNQSVKAYKENTYRYQVALFPEEQQLLFQHCTSLAKKLPLTVITRKKTENVVQDISHLINL